jgi:hypothetical protein
MQEKLARVLKGDEVGEILVRVPRHGASVPRSAGGSEQRVDTGSRDIRCSSLADQGDAPFLGLSTPGFNASAYCLHSLSPKGSKLAEGLWINSLLCLLNRLRACFPCRFSCVRLLLR